MQGKDYKLLVFDWDGTLMDSAARIVNCLNIAIEECELPTRSDEQLRQIIGLGLTEAVDALYPEGLSDQQQHFFLNTYRHEYIEKNLTPSPLFEGVAEMLDEFHSQGYFMAVATGKSRAGLNRVLSEQNMGSLFPVSRCADESGSKPDPAMLIEILSDYDLPASEALMVGDTDFDIEMANRAGVDSVAVTQGVHSVERLVSAQPSALIDKITQLPVWLKKKAVIQ